MCPLGYSCSRLRSSSPSPDCQALRAGRAWKIKRRQPGLDQFILAVISFAKPLQNSRFEADAVLSPLLGSLTINAKGVVNGSLNSRVDANGLDVNWLLGLSRQLRGPDRLDGVPLGRADDLGTLVINTFGGSLDGQLKALIKARQALRVYALAHPDQGPQLERLEGRLDAVASLKGPRLKELVADVQAKAHLWTDGDDQAQALQLEPVVATVKGPLFGGVGNFSFLHLPFSSLALIANLAKMMSSSTSLVLSFPQAPIAALAVMMSPTVSLSLSFLQALIAAL